MVYFALKKELLNFREITPTLDVRYVYLFRKRHRVPHRWDTNGEQRRGHSAENCRPEHEAEEQGDTHDVRYRRR